MSAYYSLFLVDQNLKLLWLVPLICMLACEHKPQVVADPAAGTFVAYPNLVYGTNDTEQNMDVDLPAVRDAQHTPVVVLIHGGSWVQGSKADFYGLGLDTFFTARGCAVVNMNYRIYFFSYEQIAPPDNLCSYEMQDVGLVMDYIRKMAGQWQINPDRVCLMGKSSGSQIALLYAYKYNTDGRIKAVIDGFGPTDFTDSSILTDVNLNDNVAALLGGAYDTNAAQWHNCSPVFYVAGAVPTVIFQGNLDVVVPPIQSLMLQDSLLTRGVPNLFFNWVGDGHGWQPDKWTECRDATWAFLSQYL